MPQSITLRAQGVHTVRHWCRNTSPPWPSSPRRQPAAADARRSPAVHHPGREPAAPVTTPPHPMSIKIDGLTPPHKPAPRGSRRRRRAQTAQPGHGGIPDPKSPILPLAPIPGLGVFFSRGEGNPGASRSPAAQAANTRHGVASFPLKVVPPWYGLSRGSTRKPCGNFVRTTLG